MDIAISVNDDLCKKVGKITGKFSGLTDFSIHSFCPIMSTTRDEQSKWADMFPVNIHNFTPDFILEDPILRPLVAESSSIFYMLQMATSEYASDKNLQISKQYRSVIRACLNKLQDALSEPIDDPVKVRKLETHITIFYSIEYLWQLIELLLIDKHSTISVVPNLLDWTKLHFPTPGQIATEMLLEMNRDIEINSEYWSTIKGLVLQGQFDIVRALLKLHSKSETLSFQLADEILKTMPMFSSYGGLSLQKFQAQRQYWITNVETKIQSGLLSTEKELLYIMKIIIGDNKTWNEICKSSECWYEYFAGYLFFSHPATKYFELGTFANDWKNQFESSGRQLRHLDQIVLCIMENNMTQVIHDIQYLGDNHWFVTHITDLLVHCDQLHITDERNSSSVLALRESLLFEFGTSLMCRESLFEIGLDYLGQSSPEGIGAREMLLAKIPLKNETQAMKIINVARKFGFVNVEMEICKVMATRSMANKRYGNALEWAIRSRENIYVTNVANVFLQHYCNTGEMLCNDLLANIGAKMLAYPRLLFLIQYYEFHKYYSQRELSDAAKLLVKLLDSNIIPEFFWPSLLADTIPLLEYKEPIIPTEETYRILHHLENDLIPFIEKQNKLKLSNTSGEVKTNEIALNLLNGCSDDLIQMVRLACARNLSRAMIIENTLIL